MKNEISVTFEGRYVLAFSNGEKNIELATKLWTEIVSECKKHDCFNILGIADTSAPINTTGAIDHVELFQKLGLTTHYRIAWVELNPEYYHTASFVETILSSYGVNCRVFMDLKDARKWLFYGNYPLDQQR